MKKIITVLLTFLLLAATAAGCTPTVSEPSEGYIPPPSSSDLSTGNVDPQLLTYNGETYVYLDCTGTLYGWGQNYAFRLGLPLPQQPYSYVPIVMATDVVSVAQGGGFFTILKTDGTVWVQGGIATREYDGTEGSKLTSEWTQIDSDAVQLCTGKFSNSMCVYLKSDGKLMCLGRPILDTHLSKNVDYEKPRVIAENVSRIGGFVSRNTVEKDFLGERLGHEVNIGFWCADGGYRLAVERSDSTFSILTVAYDVKHVAPFTSINTLEDVEAYRYINTKDELVEGDKVIATDVKTYTLNMYLKNNGTLWAKGNKQTFGLGLDDEVSENYVRIMKKVDTLYHACDHSTTAVFVKKTDGSLVYWCPYFLSTKQEDVPYTFCFTSVQTTAELPSAIEYVCQSESAAVVRCTDGSTYLFGNNLYCRTRGRQLLKSEATAESEFYFELVDTLTPMDQNQVAREDTWNKLTPWDEVFAKYS